MHRKQILLFFALSLCAVLFGCGRKDTPDAQLPKETVEMETELSEDEVLAEMGDEIPEEEILEEEEFDSLTIEYETETEEPIDPITPSDYLIKNPDQYVEPGNLQNLSVVQYTYKITEEDIQEQIQADLELYAEETEVDRASRNGDTVSLILSSWIDDTLLTQGEEMACQLGLEEFGAEFDRALTGVKAGDLTSFSVTFGDDAWVEEWINETVDFEAEIIGVFERKVPKYNEEFVTSCVGYDSKAAYETAIRESMESDYENMSRADAENALLESALEQAVFSSCPSDLYESCRRETQAFYMSFTESNRMEEVYELFQVTEEDLEKEIQDLANRRLFVSAVCSKYGLDVTAKEYESYVRNAAAESGYESVAQYEQDFGREAAVWTLYEEKACDYLYDHASITESSYEDAPSPADTE